MRSRVLLLVLAVTAAATWPACAEPGAQDEVDKELDAIRGRSAVAEGGSEATLPAAWGIEDGAPCAWAWAPAGEGAADMRAVAEATRTADKRGGAGAEGVVHAQWDQFLEVAIGHARVALGAARDGGAQSKEVVDRSLDAAWTATTLLDDAVRHATAVGEAPRWERWPQLVYLRELLRSMRGDGAPEPTPGPAAEDEDARRFVVQDPIWRPRIEACRLHRLQQAGPPAELRPQ